MDAQQPPGLDKTDRRRMSLQLAGGLCLVAALFHVLGGTVLFLLASIGYVVSAVGLFEQARSKSRWGATVALVCASVNGLINLATLAYVALVIVAGSAGPRAPAVALNNLTWLLANVLILLAARSGSKTPDGSSAKKSVGIF